jgi:hypothetical protein
VVLHHVAQSSGLFVVASASLDTQGFACGDLNVVDVARVPKLFENGVGEAHHHEVLGGFLPQIVVDAEGVLFREGALDHVIEPLGAGQVCSEGFLDNHPGPTVRLRLVEAALAQVFQNDRELVRPCGKIVEAIPAGAALGIQLVESLCEGSVAFQIVKLATVIEDRRGKSCPQLLVDLLTREFSRCFFELFAEDLVALIAPRETDYAHRGRQCAVGGKIVERGDEFAMGQVAGGTENNYGARLRHCAAR